MTKTIRKLLGYLLIACLLLSGVSAMAETGKVTVNLGTDAQNGFTNPEGIGFELFYVGKPSSTTDTAWAAADAFADSAKGLEKKPSEDGKSWNAEERQAIIKAIQDDLDGKTPVTKGTNKNGTVTFEDLEAGIYYVQKNAESRPRLLEVSPFLIAVPAVGTDNPYDVTYGLNNSSADVKFVYHTPEKIPFPVTKTWLDDSDFDEIQPENVTVHLYRKLGDAEEREPDFEKSTTLSADNSWTDTWEDLDSADENGVRYNYYVVEDAVEGYTTSIVDGAITNTHTPEYGAIRVTKQVTVNGQPTTGKLADGTYNFTITGPSEAPKSKNYLDEVKFTIAVTDGKSDTWSREKIKPGTYKIKEITDGLTTGMSVVGSNEQTVEVKAGTTRDNPAEVAFTNNLVTGSLKITKTVTVNSQSTRSTRVDGTYRFTVQGPSYPNGEVVAIKIKNGRSNSVQLDNLLLGEYEVTEIKTGLPAGVSYISGDGKKTLAAANTAQVPLTFTFVNNRTVTQPPSEARTPTPPRVTPTPTATPVVTPTPTPTPSPTPAVNIGGEKVWRDDGNAHNTRPASIKVQLLRDGEQIREITVSGGAGNRWSFNFGNLPKVDENGSQYQYTVSETPVEGYTTTVRGTTIINELVPQTPKVYTSFSGNKIWKDDDNAEGDRPNYIVVRLMRDGREVERRTVTAANGWQYTFQNEPMDDGYGNSYEYAIREDAVSGYVGRVEDFVVTNSRLPRREKLTEFTRYGTPLAGFGEPELEELLELFDYGTPLWGRPLQTGDDIPLYPIVFGGIGAAAVIALAILMVIGKKRNRSAA